MFLEWYGNYRNSVRLARSFSGNMGQICWMNSSFYFYFKTICYSLNTLWSAVCNDVERPWAEFGFPDPQHPAEAVTGSVVLWSEHGTECQLCCLLVCDVTEDTFLKCALLSSSPETEKSELPPRTCTNVPIAVPEAGAVFHKLQGDCIIVLSMTESAQLKTCPGLDFSKAHVMWSDDDCSFNPFRSFLKVVCSELCGFPVPQENKGTGEEPRKILGRPSITLLRWTRLSFLNVPWTLQFSPSGLTYELPRKKFFLHERFVMLSWNLLLVETKAKRDPLEWI